MFCTCADEVKIKTIKNRYGDTYTQKVFPKYIQFIWTLRRHTAERSMLDGMLELPASHLGEELTTDYVLSQLNAQNCFDFAYQPQKGDNLVITSNQNLAGYLSCVYENGQWEQGHLSPFDYQLETIEEGKIECRT
ncbi:hypothetical protein BKI52_33310 [marine bacterium AO1-C]|nr:hypothetical protein BKI52_33310 [marine bacterium AO1-C]